MLIEPMAASVVRTAPQATWTMAAERPGHDAVVISAEMLIRTTREDFPTMSMSSWLSKQTCDPVHDIMLTPLASKI